MAIAPLPNAAPMKAAALAYAARGWKVFPVHEMLPNGVCSCPEAEKCGRPGKHPRTVGGVNEASSEKVTVEGWWTRWPEASIGIATGRASGLTVIDADASDNKPGVVNLTTIAAPHGGVPATLVANTGGGGLHLYFAYVEALRTGTNVLAEAVDVRNDGGYVIAPPSGHKSGGQYLWREPKATLGTLPDWLLAAKDDSAPGKKRRGRPRVKAGFRIERIESMLSVVSPDDRERWLRVGVIMGRLYVGSGMENDAWTLYEKWAARSPKFEEDRAGSIARMREMFYERSQEPPRAGGETLSVGSLISWAREAGWTPFGDRAQVAFEPGDEGAMSEALVRALTDREENVHFNVMGEVRDVLKTTVPIVRMMQKAAEEGVAPPETLVVRKTTPLGLAGALSTVAVLTTRDKAGMPTARSIPQDLAGIILKQFATAFPVLSGIAEWPMVGQDGEIIYKKQGYDKTTGLYFEIDPSVKIDEKLKADAAWDWLRGDILGDFPFETEEHIARCLGMMLSFMQRPLMKTCPAFAAVAPQPLTGKSTLIEISSLAIHGVPVASHAWSDEPEELRKALHSLLLSKMPAVMFDNITRGRELDSDHLAKMMTSEMATDRVLGSSETRKELNTLLITFTGNNIAFVRDLASRVITVRLNAKQANPMARPFKHRDIRAFVAEKRNKILSSLVSILRNANGLIKDGLPTRFEDFDLMIAPAVHAVTGLDLRISLNEAAADPAEAEADEAAKSGMEVLWKWQQLWRKENNGKPWRTAELISGVEAKIFDEAGMAILRRWVSNQRAWEADPGKAITYRLRLLNNDHTLAPFLLTSAIDKQAKVNQWTIKREGAEPLVAQPKQPAATGAGAEPF